MQTTQQPQKEQQRTSLQPSYRTLLKAVSIAVKQDKPIMLDYYVPSARGKVVLRRNVKTNENYLYKDEEEYTSNVVSITKSDNEYICITENSIYITDHVMQQHNVRE